MRIDRTEHTYDEEGNLLRQALVLNQHGIVEDWRLGFDRLIPWEDVARVTWRRHGLAEIVTRRGTIKLDERVENLRELVAEAGRYVADRGLARSALTPEGRCRRLGVEPGADLIIDERPARRAVTWAFGGLAAVLWVIGLATWESPLLMAALFPTVIGVIARLIPPRTFRADGAGIRVTRGSASEEYLWSAVSGVGAYENTYTFRFGKRSLAIGGDAGTAKLVATAQAVLDARRLGYEPLEDEPTPDTALSLAETPEAGLQHGLSRAGERMGGDDEDEQVVSER